MFNTKTIIYIVGIILVILLLKKPASKKTPVSSEKLKIDRDQAFSEKVVDFFKNQTVLSFEKYLLFLTESTNISSKILSKEVYNDFMNNRDKLDVKYIQSKL